MTAPGLQKHDGKQHEQAALSSFHDGKRRAGFDVVHSSVAIQSHGPGAPCAVRWSGRARCCQRHAADIAIRAASLPAGYAAARACAVGGGGRAAAAGCLSASPCATVEGGPPGPGHSGILARSLLHHSLHDSSTEQHKMAELQVGLPAGNLSPAAAAALACEAATALSAQLPADSYRTP